MIATRKNFFIGWLLLFTFLFNSCGPVNQPESASPSPTSYHTPTLSATIEPKPTQTTAQTAQITIKASPTTQPPIVTPTDLSLLSNSPPWLVFAPGGRSIDFNNCPEELAIVNPDGTGMTQIWAFAYDPDENASLTDSSNQLLFLEGCTYLVQAHLERSYLLKSPLPDSRVSLSGGAQASFLASIRHVGNPQDTEIVVYQLPDGEILEQIPLVKCPMESPNCQEKIYEEANQALFAREPVGGPHQMIWSPDGRTLAFAAIRSNTSTDLYIYEPEKDRIRQVAEDPNQIGNIFWSPDGKWLLFEGLTTTEASLWSIALDGSQVKKLYTTPRYGGGENIIAWLDNKQFITQNGFFDVDGFSHLQLVDLASRNVEMLYDGDFHLNGLIDRRNETLAIYVVERSAKQPPWPGYEGPGIYLISTQNLALHFVGGIEYQPNWDEALGLFVTEVPCENDPQGAQAFDAQGQWHCVHKPAAPDNFPSPDRQWQIVINNGIWFNKADGETVGKISLEEADEIIWRPDSQGFFLASGQSLHYVSVPDLSTRVVTDQMRSGSLLYQWLEGG